MFENPYGFRHPAPDPVPVGVRAPVGGAGNAPDEVPWGMLRMVQKKADPAVIRAAAALLESDPGISNLRMLQRLAVRLGPGVTRDIPVTRVERMVREPALLLIRMGGTNGHATPSPPTPSSPPPPSASQTPPPAPQAPPPAPRDAAPGPPDPAPPARAPGGETPSPGTSPRAAPVRERTLTPARREGVDDALLEAFALGATAESPRDLVEAFRKLEAIRRRLAPGRPPRG